MADRNRAQTQARVAARAARPPKPPRPPRQCKGECGRESTTPTSNYCGTCRLAKQQAKRTPDAEVGYSLAHQRVARFRGRPGSHQCEHCDQPAEDWAYDHADPAEKIGTTNRGKSAPFSVDPAHYLPLCRRCHHATDLAHVRSEKAPSDAAEVWAPLRATLDELLRECPIY